MTAKLLEIADLQVDFPGLVRSATVLRGVSLTVHAGDVLGLVGESGSGKSMTALACLGMVPPPGRTKGSAKVEGYEIVGRADAGLRSLRGGKIAMVFQNPMRSLNPFFTVGRQMTEVIRRHRVCGEAEARVAAVEGLKSVYLPDSANVLGKYPHQLSGGQVQRVMIALALACRPKLLIADEPTTSLDVTVQAQILALLRELADRADLTVLFITHNLGAVSQLCNRVAVMYAGQIVESGSVEDVIDRPRHPYTARLMSTVPTVGRGSRELESIRGQVPSAAFLPSGCAFHERCEFATKVCVQTEPKARRVGFGHDVACHRADKFKASETETLTVAR